jgi:hypothetical protein
MGSQMQENLRNIDILFILFYFIVIIYCFRASMVSKKKTVGICVNEQFVVFVTIHQPK